MEIVSLAPIKPTPSLMKTVSYPIDAAGEGERKMSVMTADSNSVMTEHF
jgi:hypothetical protein